MVLSESSHLQNPLGIIQVDKNKIEIPSIYKQDEKQFTDGVWKSCFFP